MRLVKWAQMLALAALMVGSVSTIGFAQPGGGGGRGPGGGMMGGMMGGGGVLSLLRMEEVRKELQIDESQTKKLEEISTAIRDSMPRLDFAGLRDLSDEERTKKMDEFQKAMADATKKQEAKLDDILDPDQSSRLMGLLVQRENVRAVLSYDKVAAAITLTDEQKTKLTTIDRESRNGMRQRGGGGAGGAGGERPDFAQIREQMEKARKETEEKMAAVLTDAQKKKLEELKGAKFEFPERGFGGPGGGQGPGGGRPGRPRNDN